MIESRTQDNASPRFADFYRGKSVFVTGASGFVGVVLLETLLRCCPGIKSIFILLRSKKGVQPQARKEQIFNRKIFENLKAETPEFLEKVRVIVGDISMPKLGMSEEDMQLIVGEVSVVFHCAAVINFTKPLQFVLVNNVLSVSRVIDLCRQMKKFQALVYTSTAYSNSNLLNLTIKEEIHRLPIRAEKFLDALNNEDNEMLQELMARCKPDWPNSYTFSKCLAENVIMDTAPDLPVAIIRPSIVICTWKHPITGYVEGNSGITALSLGVGKGFLKVFYADPNFKVNMVPGDIVANTHVIAAWSVGGKRCRSPLVVNCTATENLNIKFCEHNDSLVKLAREFPLPQSFEKPRNLIIVPYKYLYYILAAYYHYLPAVVLDGMLKILGKRTRIYSLYRFFDKIVSSVSFFTFHYYELERENMELLDKLIQLEGRMDLGLDFRDANILELTSSIPAVSPFYDWKLDRKSKAERLKIIYKRHILITCIQWMFLMICCLFIYWVFSLTIC